MRKKGAVGLCSFHGHYRDMTWEDIREKDCLERRYKKRCKWFTWLSLKERDQWCRRRKEQIAAAKGGGNGRT